MPGTKRPPGSGRAESRLLLLGLLGGWPGGLLAQHWLRHKTAKAAFRWRFRCAVAGNLALLAGVVLSFRQYF